AMADSEAALKRFLLSNEVKELAPSDEIFRFNAEEHRKLVQGAPWSRDPTYFKYARISATALIKMLMHAKSGAKHEIMGIIRGRILPNTMVVTDSFALPVEGTETRVNAQAQANEYMCTYHEDSRRVGRQDNVIGWYHSHPGYGCWLSGIDVTTQTTHQQYEDPYLAVVVDHVRTISAGRVELGAFRTYPQGYKPADEPPSQYQPIPLNKIEDFGVHCRQYYALEVSYFRSSLDSHLLNRLWSRYWVSTLSSNTLFSQSDYLLSQSRDLADKLEQAEAGMGRQSALMDALDSDDRVAKLARDTGRLVTEELSALSGLLIKDLLFNRPGAKP
ncbi:hypothetical protein BOX15_Mlig014433g2, partial [Macrostomum lignano]